MKQNKYEDELDQIMDSFLSGDTEESNTSETPRSEVTDNFLDLVNGDRKFAETFVKLYTTLLYGEKEEESLSFT